MSWYWYKRGGWEMAVNAVNRSDADQHIRSSAPGAKYQGERLPSRVYSTATGMVTAKMQQVIHDEYERLWESLSDAPPSR